MTTNKKQIAIRERMAQTGEGYAAARWAVLAQEAERSGSNAGILAEMGASENLSVTPSADLT